MEFQEQLELFREWAFDLSGWWQKLMWAGLALVLGYVVGVIISRIVVFTSRRLAGLARRRSKDTDQGNADSIVIDILGSLIRGAGVLAGAAVAAWVFGFPIERLQSFASSALLAIVILIAAWFIGAWLGSHIRSFGDKISRGAGTSSRTLFSFLSSVVRFSALAIGLIAALQQFGFPIASLVAVVGAAGLAIALSLQDTLKAVAAGVVIAVFRPYRVGDFVRIAGEEGTVADITPFTTALNTTDNKEVVITNDKAWGDIIVNFTARSLRRLDLIFSISYDDDIDKAMRIIDDVFSSDYRVRPDPPIWMKVHNLGDFSVDIRVRAWCANGDWLDLRGDMLKGVKQAFDREGVMIPYPHAVHIQRRGPDAGGSRKDEDKAASVGDDLGETG